MQKTYQFLCKQNGSKQTVPMKFETFIEGAAGEILQTFLIFVSKVSLAFRMHF